MKRLLFVCLAAVGAVVIGHAQTPLDPAKLLNPGTDSWPSYNGDYSGRRFSTLTKINDKNVGALSLAWVYRVNLSDKGATTIKGTPIVIDGVMYLTVPDHVWAIDARTGRQLWHHAWTSKGGIHIGNRGVAVLGDALFYETPDCTLVSLNIKDGSERWHKQICDLEQFYYGSVAPIAVKNHIIAGVSGDDLDVPGYVQAHDPVTGEMQWRWYAVPQKQGDPGSDTWPNEEAGRHGGGMTWQPVTYDPELNLVYVTTGNPAAGHRVPESRGGQPLHGVDRGAQSGYRKDGVVLPVVAERHARLGRHADCGPDRRRGRWASAQAARAGVPQRQVLPPRPHEREGHRVVRLCEDQLVERLRREGSADSQPGEEAAGRRRSRDARSGRRRRTGPRRASAPRPDSSTSPRRARSASSISTIRARTRRDGAARIAAAGRSRCCRRSTTRRARSAGSHRWDTNTHSGLLTTAGNLLFAGGNSQDLVALNATTGEALWHARLGNGVSNGPITYEMDGRQYVIVGAGDTLFAFVMNNGR